MFDAIAATVDWSAVYLALAEVAILLAGLWVALRGAKAILRFIMGSSQSGGGWDYSEGDPDWQSEAADQAGHYEWAYDDTPSGGTMVWVGPPGDEPDSSGYPFESGPSGDSWEYMQASAEADGTAYCVGDDDSGPESARPAA